MQNDPAVLGEPLGDHLVEQTVKPRDHRAREQANIFRVNDHLCARFRGSTRMSQHLAHIFPYTGIGMNIELDRCHPHRFRRDIFQIVLGYSPASSTTRRIFFGVTR